MNGHAKLYFLPPGNPGNISGIPVPPAASWLISAGVNVNVVPSGLTGLGLVLPMPTLPVIKYSKCYLVGKVVLFVQENR